MDPQEQSIRAKLASLAKKMNIPYDRLFTHFMLERIASRLSTDPTLERNLVFKGGYVGVRVYDSERFTTDIDMVLKGLDRKDAVHVIQAAMDRNYHDGVWFHFLEIIDLETQGEYGGNRLVYKGGTGSYNNKKLIVAQNFHIDFGIGDPITPKPVHVETEFLIGGGSISWLVYPVETILSEKIHTLITRGSANSRAKDIYDIAFYLPKADPHSLRNAIDKTFDFRHDKRPENIASELEAIDLSLLAKGWTRAVESLKSKKSIEDTYRDIVEALKRSNI